MGTKCITGVNDLGTLFPEIAAQWHPEKNGDMTPNTVQPGSNFRAFWRCEKGHEWIASINGRGSSKQFCGCPFCSNRKVLSGYNDIASQYPELKLQWHPTKNGKLTPEDVIAGSNKKVWWRCEAGHEWESNVFTRTHRGAGCPVCNNKIIEAGFNDLATIRPDIAAEWHPTKNGKLLPTEVALNSKRKVWWRDSLGHEWKTTLSDRISRGSSCPYCAGRMVLPGFNDLATAEPKLAEEWFYPLNHGLTPKDVTAGSRKKVWWKASCGHAWKVPVVSRTVNHTRCPFCYGRGVDKKLREYERMYESEMKLLGTASDFETE